MGVAEYLARLYRVRTMVAVDFDQMLYCSEAVLKDPDSQLQSHDVDIGASVWGEDVLEGMTVRGHSLRELDLCCSRTYTPIAAVVTLILGMILAVRSLVVETFVALHLVAPTWALWVADYARNILRLACDA
jgi:hypothetical protein